ncbi:hypothetical protein AAG906_001656 [Vitis piasezkii]
MDEHCNPRSRKPRRGSSGRRHYRVLNVIVIDVSDDYGVWARVGVAMGHHLTQIFFLYLWIILPKSIEDMGLPLVRTIDIAGYDTFSHVPPSLSSIPLMN